MLGELVPRGGGDSIPLLKSRLLIGRRDSCDICLQFSNVSSRHCELEFLNGYWQVRDLGSANGTKVNGVRVEQKFLFPGDELGVAKHFYTIQYTPLADAPPEEPVEDMKIGLLEKAGLESSRPRRPKANGEAPPTRPAASPASSEKPAPKDDDDLALEWLRP